MTIWDFSDYTDITRTQCVSTNWIAENPAKFLGSSPTPGRAAIHVSPSGFSGGESFTVYGRMKLSSNSADAFYLDFYARAVNDNEMRIGVNQVGGGTYKMGKRVELVLGSPPGCNRLTPYNDVIAAQPNRWIWFRMVYTHSDNNVKFYYNIENVTNKPSNNEWTAYGEETIVLDQVTEIGLMAEGWNATVPVYADDLEIDQHLIRIENLDLGTAILQDIYAYSKIGGGGRCLLTIGDPGIANRRTIEANTGKAIIVKDLSNRNHMFLGEVSKFSIINANQCRLEVKEASQKMLDNVTNHIPIIYSGKVRHRKTNSIIDRGPPSPYTSTWGDNAYAISLEKVNPKIIKVYADSAVFSSDVAPVDDEQGSIEYCYFDEPERAIELDAIIAREVDNSLYLDISFEFWLPEGAPLDPGDLLLRFRLGKSFYDVSPSYTTAPKVQIWRILPSTAWETIKQWGNSDGIHRSNDGDQGLAGYEDFTKIYEYAIDLSSVLDQSTNSYFDEIEAENASGLTHHRVKFRIDHGSFAGGGAEKYQVALHYAHLELRLGDFGYLIEPQVGLGRLHSDTTSIMLVFENTGWGSVQLPAEDGFSDGDTFVITKWIPDIVADAFSAAGIGLLLDWDVTDSINYTITENISKMKLATLLQQLGSQFNAYWWFDAINTIYVRSIDNASSTGTILTDKDIESYLDGTMKYDADGEKLREKLTIIGRNVSYTIDPLTPEHNLLLDTATIIIKDGTISTVRAAKRKADSMRYQFEKTIKEIRLPLNFSDPLQSYRDLKLGETVSYVHPKLVGDVFNFSGSIVNGNAADGELLITAWLYRWGKSTDYQDLVNLTLQRRYT